jgi:hypothetical protein
MRRTGTHVLAHVVVGAEIRRGVFQRRWQIGRLLPNAEKREAGDGTADRVAACRSDYSAGDERTITQGAGRPAARRAAGVFNTVAK